MKNFEVSRLENSSYDYLVIATTYISPISTLDEVQKAFKNISGKILFNLTLINGLNSNRYISAIIENGIVNRKSFLIEKDVDDKFPYGKPQTDEVARGSGTESMAVRD